MRWVRVNFTFPGTRSDVGSAITVSILAELAELAGLA